MCACLCQCLYEGDESAQSQCVVTMASMVTCTVCACVYFSLVFITVLFLRRRRQIIFISTSQSERPRSHTLHSSNPHKAQVSVISR